MKICGQSFIRVSIESLYAFVFSNMILLIRMIFKKKHTFLCEFINETNHKIPYRTKKYKRKKQNKKIVEKINRDIV